MGTLNLIEAARGGPFVIQWRGWSETLPDPADLTFQHVLVALEVDGAPGAPDDLPLWMAHELGQQWAAHYDLPDFKSAQRLCYLLDRYRTALVYDLAHWCHADLNELWLARRWRTLLDFIDHLPGWSWYSSAVFNDEEHAAMLAESMKSREEEGDRSNAGPPQHHWTPEVAAITNLTDSVNQLIIVTSAASGGKPPAFKALPRPTNQLEAILKRQQFANRQAKHENLVARMLPNKAKNAEQPR